MPEDLMERTDSLVKEYGTRWTKLVAVLTEQGLTREDGNPLTVDTIRKRYKKWKQQPGEPMTEPQRQPRKKKEVVAVPEPSKTERAHPESPDKTIDTTNATVPVEELLKLFKGSLERRDQMLADKIKNESHSRGTEDRIVSIEARLEEKLLKRLKEELTELVQDQVDQEMKTMVSPGGSFERDLKVLVAKVIEEQGSDDLASLMEGIDVNHKRPPGPGRGHKGKKTSRFSATMDEETYKSMKELAGTFSGHLTAACQLYLRAMESKREHTR